MVYVWNKPSMMYNSAAHKFKVSSYLSPSSQHMQQWPMCQWPMSQWPMCQWPMRHVSISWLCDVWHIVVFRLSLFSNDWFPWHKFCTSNTNTFSRILVLCHIYVHTRRQGNKVICYIMNIVFILPSSLYFHPMHNIDQPFNLRQYIRSNQCLL